MPGRRKVEGEDPFSREYRDRQLRILREVSTRGGWRYALVGSPVAAAVGLWALVTGDAGAAFFMWACALGVGVYGFLDFKDDQ